VAYLCFQGEPSGFDENDSFQKELNEEYRSNEAPGEQTEAYVSKHDRAQGGIAVLKAPKGRTANSTVVPLAVHLCTGGHVGWHSHYKEKGFGPRRISTPKHVFSMP